MALVNIHFLNLQNNYLFADIAKKVNAFKVMHPKADVISLGIGDVTQPLCPAVIEAMHKAVDEMATADGFRGYGPEQGYEFLREAILKNDFAPRGVRLSVDEVFINDGAKSDTGNFQELLHWDNFIGVTDPIYPVYIDSNVMIGRCGTYRDGRWSNVRYMPTTAENGFVPEVPKGRPVDVIYLCFPNNPTGTVITKQELRKWVNYALKNDALILFDAAYQAYIQDPDIPHSIYEIRGARKCAIEYGCPLWIHHRAEGCQRGYLRGRAHPPQPVVAPSAVYQVQWHQLHLPASCRGHLQPRREAAGEADY